MTQLNWFPIKSSMMKSIAYDESLMLLYIEFTSGSTYIYRDVEPKTFKAFKSAESHGKYFHKNIREKFDTFQVK